MSQLPRTPDLEAQRLAMSKIDFLVGKWIGEARLLRGPGVWVELVQTEEAQYKLDGLILTIEGVGKTKTGVPVLQALGIISYDDDSRTYRMRAFNDGRFLESQVELLEDSKGMSWGFALGEITTHSMMRIDENGNWSELAELTIGLQPAKKLLEITVHLQK